MESMKEVTRYQCKYCKKDFKTPNRHFCKFNPALKNCFTCKNFKSWQSGYYTNEHDEVPYPNCAKGEGEYWDIEQIKNAEYNMKCEHWQKGKYDWSKEGEDYI